MFERNSRAAHYWAVGRKQNSDRKKRGKFNKEKEAEKLSSKELNLDKNMNNSDEWKIV